MRTFEFVVRGALALLALAAVPLPFATGQSLRWTRQAGTSTYDYGYGVDVDGAGNVYVTGTTYGSLGGDNEGSSDIFLAKYDAAGNPLWLRQTGTPDTDEAYAVAVDDNGNAFVLGMTYGNFGGPHVGNIDVFLAKFEAQGDLVWVRQPGTPVDDFCAGVAVDHLGNAYISGLTYGDLGGPNADPTQGTTDAFLAKYSPSGATLWTRQLGTPADDSGNDVAVDDLGNVYLTGSTFGSLAGPNAGMDDLFLAKYSAPGGLLWMRQTGTPSYDWGNGVGVDGAGNAYIAGTTGGSLGGPGAGGADVFLTKYSSLGDSLWTRQLGTPTSDYGNALAVDRAGNAYVTGATSGSLGGPSAGSDDAFLTKFDASGSLLWTRQSGTSLLDWSYAVAVDGLGNAFIAGSTTGSLGGPNAGWDDIFLAKYGPPPCVADVDDGTGTGTPDGGVTIDDLLYYLFIFELGDIAADVDDGTSTGTPDGGVTIDDLLYYLTRFEAGC